MKFPNHIILDFSKPTLANSSQYWIFKYIYSLQKNIIYLSNFSLNQKYFFRKENLILNKILINQKKFTVKYNFTNLSLFLNKNEKNFINKIHQPRIKVKHKQLDSKFVNHDIYNFLINEKQKYNEKIIKRLLKNFSFSSLNTKYSSNNLWRLFDINFLKKEKIYTKLKYSRVPQYDIVSGGAAALFAGFLGFLICEKFGFELADSGDFYFLFMYLVFLFFFIRLFFKIMEFESFSWNIISLKWLIFFYKNLFNLFINYIYLKFKK